MEPYSFFDDLSPLWKGILNTPRLSYIQNKFRCCGYKSIKEFEGDTCIDSKTKSCFKQLAQRYDSNVRSCGVYALMTAFCSLFTIVVFVLVAKKKKAKTMHRGRVIQ